MEEEFKNTTDQIIVMLCDLAFGSASEMERKLIALWYSEKWKTTIEETIGQDIMLVNRIRSGKE